MLDTCNHLQPNITWQQPSTFWSSTVRQNTTKPNINLITKAWRIHFLKSKIRYSIVGRFFCKSADIPQMQNDLLWNICGFAKKASHNPISNFWFQKMYSSCFCDQVDIWFCGVLTYRWGSADQKADGCCWWLQEVAGGCFPHLFP